ncbi:MAG: leucine-rich repeat protein [Oscillospiraceae bacterium]|nr:leucine-rich repeat protein [Oscillospiraceae bacterium]
MNMKRIIAAVITASIIGGAAGSGMQMINAEELGPHFTVPHKELKSSGSYDSVSWTIDEEGTLTISGTGYLPNNFTGQDVYGHWFTCIPVSVKKIVIEEGITRIDSHTFASCNVVSVDIASSVKYIDNGAFEYCTDLETVNLHEGLERIENYAFENCWSLESIKLPESVTYIGSRAFGICNHLKEISFPESLPEFPEGITECYEKDSFIFTPWYEEYLENNRFVIWNGVVLDGKPVNGVLEIPDTATGIAEENTSKESFSDCMKGDATGDGIVDISDITMLSLYLLGDNSLDENQQKAADIDDNDKVDLADLARLMQYISKKIESL